MQIALLVLAIIIILGLVGNSIEGTKKLGKSFIDFIALPFRALVHGKKVFKNHKIDRVIKAETKRYDKAIKDKIVKIQMSHPEVSGMISQKENKLKTLEDSKINFKK